MRSIILCLSLCIGFVTTVSAQTGPSLFENGIPQIDLAVDFRAAGSDLQTGTTNYAAVLRIGGLEVGAGAFKFIPSRVRDSQKPSFVLELVDQPEVRRALGGTNFIFETADFWPLGPYAVGKLGERVGLPVPRVGHALLSFNQRGLGIYTVTDRSPRIELITNPRLVLITGGDLPEMQKAAGMGAASNFIGEVVQACLHPDVDEAHEKMERWLDAQEWYRELAFEAVIGDAHGYGEQANAGTMAFDPIEQRLRLYPEIHQPAFPVIFRPVMTQKRGIIARALMETPQASQRYTAAVRELVTDPGIEGGLLQDIEARSRLLEPLLSGPSELQKLQLGKRHLVDQIRARFDAVRGQLAALPPVLPSTKQMPLMTMGSGKSGKGLPVKNPVDYGDRFMALLQTNAPLVPSRPISFYTMDVAAPKGVLEGLSWKSTNWVQVGLVAEETSFTNASLRLKGHGTRHGFDKKPSFTLKFGGPAEGQRFHDSTKIHVQSSIYDPSYLNQFIGAWLCQRARVPTAKIEFAEVKVNGKDYGVFVVSEGITKGFLKREFGTAQGLLFEGEAGDLNGRLELDSGQPPSPYSRPQDAYAAALSAANKRSLTDMAAYFDLASLADFCAAEMLLGHHDGYMLHSSNYRVYQTSPDAPFHFIAHGMDWLKFEMEQAVPAPKGAAAQALLQTPDGRRKYLDALARLADVDLDMEALVRDAAVVTRLLQPALKKVDPSLARMQMAAAADNLRVLGDRKIYLKKESLIQQEYAAPVAAR